MDKRLIRSCKNCIYHRRGKDLKEYFISKKYAGYDMKATLPIKMCQHPMCFKKAKRCDIMGSYIKTIRIAGPVQLNKNGQCNCFRRKWWKIWVKK